MSEEVAWSKEEPEAAKKSEKSAKSEPYAATV
jgi:hypothetical protein